LWIPFLPTQQRTRFTNIRQARVFFVDFTIPVDHTAPQQDSSGAGDGGDVFIFVLFVF